MAFQDNIPIYVQIADDIKNQIVRGSLPEEEKLGSIREYSARYQVTALTVQRGIQLLEHQGIITTRKGVGSFVVPGARERLRREMVAGEIRSFLQKMTGMGFHDREILEMVKEEMEDGSIQVQRLRVSFYRRTGKGN